MKKISKIATFLAATAVLTGSFAFAKEYTDTTNLEESYKEAITSLSDKGIINGYEDSTFRPSNSITRAEIAKIIVTAFDIKKSDNSSANFSDVSNEWFASYVEIASSNGIINGYEDKTFRPQKEVTYGELCALLVRIVKAPVDTSSSDDWSTPYMEVAEKIGLFDGTATNDIISISKARRDNATLMVFNALKYLKESETSTSDVTSSGDDSNVTDNIEANNQSASSGENTSIDSDKNDDKSESSQTTEDTSKESSNDDSKDTVTINPIDKTQIDTKKIYLAQINKLIEYKGEQYLRIESFNDESSDEFDLKIIDTKKNTAKYLGFLVYKVKSTGDVRQLDLFNQTDWNKDYMLVTKVEDNVAAIKDSEDYIDFEASSYTTISGEEIVFSRYKYMLINATFDEDSHVIVDDADSVELEDLKLKKDDRIYLDTTQQIMFILRGLENDDIVKE